MLRLHFYNLHRLLPFSVLLFFQQTLPAQNLGAEWRIKPVLSGIDNFFLPALGQDILVATKNGKQGMLDVNNRVVVPFNYDRISVGSSGWIGANIGKDNFWLCADGTVLNPLYDEIKTDWSGIALVKKNNKWGVIESTAGKVTVPLEYDAYEQDPYRGYILKKGGVEGWVSGRTQLKRTAAQAELLEKESRKQWPGVRVFQVNNLYGFTTLTGDTLSPAVYEVQHFLPQGYATVSKEKGKWLVINQKNEVLLELACQTVYEPTSRLRMPVKQNGKWGIIQIPDGKAIVPPDAYDNLYRTEGEFFVVTKGDKQGMVNDLGKAIIPVAYNNISEAREGRIKIITQDKLKGTCWGPTGFRVEPKYRRIDNQKDSILTVQSDSLWTLFNPKTGKELFPPRYATLERRGAYFVGGTRVNGQLVLSTLLDRNGKELLPADSVQYYAFSDGTLFVSRKGAFTHRTVDGKVLHEFKPDEAGIEKDIYIRVKKQDGKYRYFLATDVPGKENWLDQIGKLEDGIRSIGKDGLFGYANADGKIIVQPVLDEAKDSEQGLLKVKYKGNWGVLVNPEARKY